jgi:hypothetical protein
MTPAENMVLMKHAKEMYDQIKKYAWPGDSLLRRIDADLARVRAELEGPLRLVGKSTRPVRRRGSPRRRP